MIRHRVLALAVLLVVALGLAATVVWLSGPGVVDRASQERSTIAAALAITALLTTANIALRWLRWHNLTRRIGVPIPAKESLRLYLATLPAIATPYYAGELLRAAVLRRRVPGATRPLVLIWLAERASDAAALVVLMLATAGSPWVIAVIALWVLTPMLLHRISPPARESGLATAGAIGSTVVLSLAAWTLPVVALSATLRLLDTSIPFERAASAFGGSTLLGGLSGIPLGTALTGGELIRRLQSSSVAEDTAPLIAAVFRSGTTWFAITLGLACLVAWRRKLARLLHPDETSHFEVIGSEYDQQIPEHVRDRLVTRKAELMAKKLARHGYGTHASGLELGCGHAWYAAEMATREYDVTAFDSATSQARAARVHVSEQHAEVTLCVADAAHLPYPDRAFDFAYAVNVLHHVEGDATRAKALDEIVRTLRPGGVFLLHEINSRNLLFRFYMGYVFPLIRDIDEGTEVWIRPGALPEVRGAHWEPDITYFTFLPDFLPESLHRRFAFLERRLERSRLRHRGAHYVACLVKDGATGT